jgi:murein DD-endopeptidase MepM/ murein hydrolase activator NlpD
MWLAGLLSAVRLPGLGRPAVSVAMAVSIAVVCLVAAFIWRVRTGEWDAAVSAPLTFPLRGRWYVVQGGASRVINHHVTVPRQRAALDLVRTGARGSKGGPGLGNEVYLAYGQPVYAPCDGTVIAVRDGLPDQVPGTVVPQPAEGNEVVIDTGTERVRLCHLRPGTVRVAKGQPVRAGDLLGAVGNSGNSSEPHLHIEASRDGLGVELRFAGNPGRYWSGRTLRG